MAKRKFKNKVVAITGASGNLGLELSLRFGKNGAKIIALDLRKDALAHLSKLLDKHKIPHITEVCDITDEENCRTTLQECVKKMGRIDVLINNAGITHIERYRSMDKEKNILKKVMNVNFYGAVNCADAVLEQIIERKGMIINISSVAGFAPLLGRTAYAASKHALHGFFESLRSELVDTGTKILMVCPSFVGPSKKVNPNLGDQSIHQPKKVLGKVADPSKVAAQIYQAAREERNTLIVGKTGRISYYLRRLAPKKYENIMTDRLKNEVF